MVVDGLWFIVVYCKINGYDGTFSMYYKGSSACGDTFARSGRGHVAGMPRGPFPMLKVFVLFVYLCVSQVFQNWIDGLLIQCYFAGLFSTEHHSLSANLFIWP